MTVDPCGCTAIAGVCAGSKVLLEINELDFIEAGADLLRVLDGSDPAMEKSQVPRSIDFSSVGAQMHPGNEVLYACTGSKGRRGRGHGRLQRALRRDRGALGARRPRASVSAALVSVLTVRSSSRAPTRGGAAATARRSGHGSGDPW